VRFVVKIESPRRHPSSDRFAATFSRKQGEKEAGSEIQVVVVGGGGEAGPAVGEQGAEGRP